VAARQKVFLSNGKEQNSKGAPSRINFMRVEVMALKVPL
jgi:hypothetical protein